MHSRLNIPLRAPATRRSDRRVVWILGSMLCGALLALIVWRGLATIDRSSNAAPEGTIASVRIMKTPKTAQILHDKLGSMAVIAGDTQTFDDVLAAATHEFTIHIGGHGISGVSVDSSGGAWRFSPRMIFPWNDGELRLRSEDKIQSFPLSIREESITVSGIPLEQGPETITALPPGSEIIAAASLPPSMIGLSELVAPAKTAMGNAALFESIQSSGINAVLGKDATGLIVSLFIPDEHADLTVIEGSMRDMINLQRLSTLELTLEDDTVVSEIRIPEGEIKKTLSNETGYSILTLTDGKSIVRATKTSEGLTISNREISLSEDSPAVLSACLSDARFFFKPEALLNAAGDRTSVQKPTGLTITSSFSEIAINDGKLQWCW